MPAEAGLECVVLFHHQSSRRRLRPLSALLAFLLLCFVLLKLRVSLARRQAALDEMYLALED